MTADRLFMPPAGGDQHVTDANDALDLAATQLPDYRPSRPYRREEREELAAHAAVNVRRAQTSALLAVAAEVAALRYAINDIGIYDLQCALTSRQYWWQFWRRPLADFGLDSPLRWWHWRRRRALREDTARRDAYLTGGGE